MVDKKPAWIILLIIFLVWHLGDTISRMLVRDNSTDIVILYNYNLAWLGYILIFVILILNILSLVAVFTKKKRGFIMICSFLFINIIYLIFMNILAISNFELTKEAYIESRMSRGLSVERIDVIYKPWILASASAAAIAFYLFILFYVYKKRDYFIGK